MIFHDFLMIFFLLFFVWRNVTCQFCNFCNLRKVLMLWWKQNWQVTQCVAVKLFTKNDTATRTSITVSLFEHLSITIVDRLTLFVSDHNFNVHGKHFLSRLRYYMILHGGTTYIYTAKFLWWYLFETIDLASLSFLNFVFLLKFLLVFCPLIIRVISVKYLNKLEF